jgi:dimethylhistidine N-methyltransferase
MLDARPTAPSPPLAEGRADSFRRAVLSGLASQPKSIPPRFLYDDVGSDLFEQICRLPEYYLTRTETGILDARAAEIAALVGAQAFLIELGSGSSAKTRILLDAFAAPAGYAPIDISRGQLRRAAAAIARDYPRLRVLPICADYAQPPALPDIGARRVAFFPGSTIGNLDRDEAAGLLRRWRKALGASGLFILGADLKKDPRMLEAAYKDRAGVTERFIKNILARANRELGADFDPEQFAYEARYRAAQGRVEMRLRARRAHWAHVAGRRIAFARGESIHVENSRKFSPSELDSLRAAAGFAPRAGFADRDGLYRVELWSSSR